MLLFKLYMAVILLLLTQLASGNEIKLLPDGFGKVANEVKFSIIHFSDKWVSSKHSGKAYQPACYVKNGVRHYKGKWTLHNDNYKPELLIEEDIAYTNSVKLRYTLATEQSIPTAELALCFQLPVPFFVGRTVTIDDKPFLFPVKKKMGNMAKFSKVHKIELALGKQLLTIKLNTPCRVLITDGRIWQKNHFSIRIKFPDCPYPVTQKHSISFTLSTSLYQSTPVDITKVANMGFADRTSNDGKGGWSDQGAKNDLSCLKPGKLAATPGEFIIADPAQSNGKSCIVLGGGGRPNFPRSVEIPLSGILPRTLLLLHAVAWCPPKGKSVGTIEVVYSDGSIEKFPVISRKDVGNWWGIESFANAKAAWKSNNGKADVILYMSCFRLSGKPVSSIKLKSNGKALWMIAGISTSSQSLFVPQPVNFIHQPSADWRILKNKRDILPGSALDFSFLLDAPAGKYGFLSVKGSHFQFEKQSFPIRFYGTNFCSMANYLEKEQAERLAERLARCGYNAVRLHHFDGNVLRSKEDSTKLDPQRLDQLDYLFYALKKRGIYITIDLCTNYHVYKGDFPAYPELGGGKRDYKLAAMLLPEVNAHLKVFAKHLLTHKNPYTNLRWADDPALIFISIINENTIRHIINSGETEIRQLYSKAFDLYAASKGIVEKSNHPEEFQRFLALVYKKYYKDMLSYLRDIGVKVPFTEQNFMMSPNLTQQRAELYDYVDNHIYWDHPSFVGKKWALPTSHHNKSVIAKHFTSPCDIAPTRIFGKPFTITEFDFCRPNQFRANGAPIFAAYSSLQNYDAIFRFAYSHNIRTLFDKNTLTGDFDAVNDPIKLLSDRIGMAFFTRGDVKPSNESFPVVVALDDYKHYLKHYPVAAQQLALRGKVGSVLFMGDGKFYPSLPSDTKAIYTLTSKLTSKNTPFPLLPATQISADKVISSTGELVADFKQKSFSATTPRSEVLVVPDKGNLCGKFINAKSIRGFSVVGAIALNGKTLKSSKRILLLHLSDVAQSGTVYSTPERRIIIKNGTGNGMARRSISEISVTVSEKDWKLYALNIAGERLGKVKFTSYGKYIRFTADTFLFPEAVFAYELICE